MAGALDHHLHIPFPRPLRQFTQGNQLLNLWNIARIRNTAWTAGIAKAQGHIVFPADLQDFIKARVERVFLPCQLHPGKDDGSTARNNIGMTLVFLKFAGCLPVDAAVDRHKIHALLRMHAHHIDPLIRSDGF